MFERARALLPSNLSDVLRECALSGRATRLRSCAFALGIVALLGSPIRADSDVFMRMVGVALTGSDNADIKVIGDRANCVFAVKNELYRLNNVYTDRINFRTFEPEAGNPRTWMTLTLHGDEIVFEETIEPPKDDGSETMRQMRAEYPDSFSTHHYRYTEYELHLTTDDKNEVKRAWQYLYSHGCTGKQSPS
jgi:hypothetical protein